MPRHPDILRLHACRANVIKLPAMVAAAGRPVETHVGKPLFHGVEIRLRFGMIAIVLDAGQWRLRHRLLDGWHPVDFAKVNELGRLLDHWRTSTATE